MSAVARIDVEHVDLSQARAYLGALTGEVDPVVTFQTFSDVKPLTPPDPLACVRHGTLDQHAAELTRLNAEGAGIFVMVNAGDLRGRKTENVTAVRAVFIDKDKTLLRPCSLRPTFIVVTSHEKENAKGHAYWRVKGELPLERFRGVQRRLIGFYGSDPGVHDICRVMRLPGFFHRKKEPTLVTFEMGSGASYTAEEILKAHPHVLVPRAPLPLLPRANRSSSAADDEIARDLVRDVADRRAWAEGDRHASAIAVAAYARKIGMSEDEIRSVIAARLVAAGKSEAEAASVASWAAGQIAPVPGDRERVVSIERRRREREGRR